LPLKLGPALLVIHSRWRRLAAVFLGAIEIALRLLVRS